MLHRPARSRPAPEARDRSDTSLRFREVMTQSRNWVDFLRAAVAATAVNQACFEMAPDAPVESGAWIFAIECAIYVVAVLVQTMRFEGRLVLTAPVFFILGLSFGLLGWQAALFACILIWVLNIALPGASMFLFVFAGLQLCFGLLLPGSSLGEAGLAAALAMLPLLLSAVTKRRLTNLSKKIKPARA